MTRAPVTDDDPRLALPEQDPRPVVALPRGGPPGGVVAIGVAILAIVLFLVLDGRRRATTSRADTAAAAPIASPPALAVPPESAPTPMVAPTVPWPIPAPLPRASLAIPPALPTMPQTVPQTVIVPTASAPEPVPESDTAPRSVARLSEPALVIDGGLAVRTAQPASPGPDSRPAAVAGAGEEAATRATVIRSRTDVMPVGTLIPAVLETPIDTARPGLVRAIVSRDTPGFDGRRVLVPRGSRLIGEYQSDVRGGQNRVLITWTRLVRPDGVSIRLGSPASDPLGGAGVPGQVHSFFLQRFAGTVLQSALTIGVNVASRPGDGSVIVGLPTAPINTIGQQLQPSNDYRPKITVKQGAALNVFVARDLDFSGIGAAR